MVYFGADAVAAYVGVQGEGKVQCCGVLRHGLEVAFRGEDENLRCKQVQFDGIEKIDGVRLRVVQNFLDGTQPFLQFAFIFAASSFFVFPVGGKALFGNVIHTLTADLHLNPLPVVAHQGDVQGLVAVGFGMADPVAQAVGVGLVYLGDGDIDVEAVVQLLFHIARFEDDAYG